MTEPNTGYYATVIADSIVAEVSDHPRARLTTIEACFPRFILAEVNTHCSIAKNSASSRAIPVAKQLERVKEHPFIPEKFPLNKPGMSADEYLAPGDVGYQQAKDAWLEARDNAIETAERFLELGLHKQTANRVLEPYLWHTAVLSASEWLNFLNLRMSEHAQPEFRQLAILIYHALAASNPTPVEFGQWHLPYVVEDEKEQVADYFLSTDDLVRISAGRCAAVTLLNQQKRDIEKDLSRTEKMIANAHFSPTEHPAVATPDAGYSKFGQYWKQFRKFIPHEDVYQGD